MYVYKIHSRRVILCKGCHTDVLNAVTYMHIYVDACIHVVLSQGMVHLFCKTGFAGHNCSMSHTNLPLDRDHVSKGIPL